MGRYYTVSSTKVNNKKLTQLYAYDKTGKKLWSKKLDNVKDLTYVYITKDGNILVTSRISSYNFIVYKFDKNGKLLNKKQIKEHIYRYENGFLVTTSTIKNKIHDSFYDDQLNLKFKYERSISEAPEHIDDEGTVYYNITLNGKDILSFGARGKNGKEIWSFPSNSFQELEFVVDKLLVINKEKHTISLFNKKGKSFKKVKFNNSFSVQITSDNKILIVENTKLTILNGTDLKQISEVVIPEIKTTRVKFFLKEDLNLFMVSGKTISKYLLK